MKMLVVLPFLIKKDWLNIILPQILTINPIFRHMFPSFPHFFLDVPSFSQSKLRMKSLLATSHSKLSSKLMGRGLQVRNAAVVVVVVPGAGCYG